MKNPTYFYLHVLLMLANCTTSFVAWVGFSPQIIHFISQYGYTPIVIIAIINIIVILIINIALLGSEEE